MPQQQQRGVTPLHSTTEAATGRPKTQLVSIGDYYLQTVDLLPSSCPRGGQKRLAVVESCTPSLPCLRTVCVLSLHPC